MVPPIFVATLSPLNPSGRSFTSTHLASFSLEECSVSIHSRSRIIVVTAHRRYGMNVLIFGSSGATGREIVKRALEQGHTVTAFARTPSKISLRHDNLTIVQGDATDSAAVA